MSTETQKTLKRLESEQRRLGHQKLLFKQLEDEGIFLPEPEFKFHRFRIDFAWNFCWLDTREEIKLALEVDGGIYLPSGGGHRSVTGFEQGLSKGNQLALERWHLLRILPEWLDYTKSDKAISLIKEFFYGKGYLSVPPQTSNQKGYLND
jgi:hypothetical protein